LSQRDRARRDVRARRTGRTDDRLGRRARSGQRGTKISASLCLALRRGQRPRHRETGSAVHTYLRLAFTASASTSASLCLALGRGQRTGHRENRSAVHTYLRLAFTASASTSASPCLALGRGQRTGHRENRSAIHTYLRSSDTRVRMSARSHNTRKRGKRKGQCRGRSGSGAGPVYRDNRSAAAVEPEEQTLPSRVGTWQRER
jgi:hypothetical protein